MDLVRRPVEYPESDGQPLGETELHILQIFELIASFRQLYGENSETHVSSNLILYYEKDNPEACVCPDLMVIQHLPPGLRRVYKLWEEKTPSLVIEITSKKTRLNDMGNKKAIYEMLGVPEYVLFDPLGDYLKPPLQSFRLVNGIYQPCQPPVTSRELGVSFEVVDNRLRVVDPSGRRVPVMAELVDQLRQTAILAQEMEARSQEMEARSQELEAHSQELERLLAAERQARLEAERRLRELGG